MEVPEAGAREALLRAAETEFSTRGVAGSRTRAIAAVAGVDQKLIAYHFGGKQGLYRAVLRRAAETLAAELAPLADLAVDDPEDALRAAIRLLTSTAEQHADLIRVVMRQLLDGSEQELTETLRAVVPPFASALASLDGFMQQGAIRSVPPGLVGLAVMSVTTMLAAIPGAAARLLPGTTREEREAMIADVVSRGLLTS